MSLVADVTQYTVKPSGERWACKQCGTPAPVDQPGVDYYMVRCRDCGTVRWIVSTVRTMHTVRLVIRK